MWGFPIEFECQRFRDPPPCTRFGKLSLSTMITELTENRERNSMLVGLISRIAKSTRQILVLSDRRQHCMMLHQCFPKRSGLYMGGMKEADLAESSTKKIIFATFSQAHEGLRPKTQRQTMSYCSLSRVFSRSPRWTLLKSKLFTLPFVHYTNGKMN